MAKPEQRFAIIAAASVALAFAAIVATAPRATAALACPGIPPVGEEGAFRRGTDQVISSKNVPIGVCGFAAQIINGTPSSYKHVVGIRYTTPQGASICTGTLLNRRLVLTAAHCGCGWDYSVTQQPRINEQPALAVLGRPILFDPLACERGILPGYDLALLKLARDADVDPDAEEGPPPLPNQPDKKKEYAPPFKLAYALSEVTRVGDKLTVMGYGLTETGTRGRRMEAEVPVYTPDCSKAQHIAAGCAPFLEMILSSSARTDGTPPTDTCNGDSGGPVFAMRKDRGGKSVPILFAVTSRPAPLPHTDLANHCGGGSINVVIGRKDVLFWLFQNGVASAFADPLFE